MDDAGGQDRSTGIMALLVRWQHVMPTAPDTLYCYPFRERDPFVMEETPHVMVAGNQGQYAAGRYEADGVRVRLVGIPRFSETGEAVMLDLGTLETEVVRIG